MEYRMKVPGRLLMFIATLQGIALLGLYRIYEHDVWPADQPIAAVPLWQLCLIFPLLLLLSLDHGNKARVAWISAGFTAVCSLFAVYIGWQLTPVGQFSGGTLIFTYVLTMIIVTFKAAMYLQAFSHRSDFTYETLFTNSWRNFLVMGLALLFVLLVALLLLLWSQLFEVIGIEFFKYLFQRDWFLFPLFGFAFGVGITVFRELTGVIDNITGLLQGLIRLLLPVLVVVTLLFLFSLAVVGTDALWATGYGSILLLWLTAILLFFVNAVYQDGRGDPVYSRGVHRLIALGILSLPVLSGLSLYGLLARIQQYGLTVERIYGLLVWLILVLFAVGYCWGILKHRDRWIHTLGQVNVGMGLVLVALLLLLSSPVADPRKMSVNSQLARLDQGEVSVDTLDVVYFRRHLARPGHLAYEDLADTYREEYPQVVQRWQHLQHHPAVQVAPGSVWDRIALRPADLVLPPDLKRLIEQTHPAYMQGEGVLMQADLDNDGGAEYLLVGMSGGYLGFARFYYLESEAWKTGQLDVVSTAVQTPTDTSILEEEIEIEPPRFFNVRLGTILLVPKTHGFSGPVVPIRPNLMMEPGAAVAK